MRLRSWRVVFLAGFFAAALGAEDLSAVLNMMEPSIVSCIQKRDTEAPIFHGCIDWHSAVHGHWALLRIARARGKVTADAVSVERVLSPQGLEQEARLLAQNPDFEMPYGRSWFLRLAIDFEIVARQAKWDRPDRLRGLAETVVQSLWRYYGRVNPTPLSREYDNASWAFYHMRQYARFTGDLSRLAAIESAIKQRFLRDDITTSFAFDRDDFFSLYGNWVYLVAKSQSPSVLGRFLVRHPVAKEHLGPPTPTTDHSLGLVWSRAWAMSALGRTLTYAPWKAVLGEAFQRHVQRGIENHRRHQSDYRAYGHWVPQFAVYAVTEAMED